MSDNPRTTLDRDTRLENFAAELTRAVYPLMLRRGLKGSWVRVELALWGALMETAEAWGRGRPRAASPGELDAWRKGFLADLNERALSIALNSGIEGPLLQLGLEVDRAFDLVIETRGRVLASDEARP